MGTVAEGAGFAGADTLSFSQAVGRARSWVLAYVRALYGEGVFERVVSRVNPAVELALASAIGAGVVLISRASTGAATRRLRARLNANNLTAVRAVLAQAGLERGSFHTWLVRAPVLDLIGVTAPVAETRALARSRLDVTPLEAVTFMAFGVICSRERVLAHAALAAHVAGMLLDDKTGRGPLQNETRRQLRGMLARLRRHERKVETARRSLQVAVTRLEVAAFSRGAGRALIEADFAVSLRLDPMTGGFVPARALADCPEELEDARRACAELGPIRLSAETLYANKLIVTPRTKVTSPSKLRAAEDLRARCQAWLRNKAPMPKKSIWAKGDGARIAGSGRAADAVWEAVTTSDPRYAPLRHPGRRKNEAP